MNRTVLLMERIIRDPVVINGGTYIQDDVIPERALSKEVINKLNKVEELEQRVKQLEREHNESL